MVDFRKFTVFAGGNPVWVNIETVTHVTESANDVVSLHFIGGAAISVQGHFDDLMQDMLPPNRSGPRTS